MGLFFHFQIQQILRQTKIMDFIPMLIALMMFPLNCLATNSSSAFSAYSSVCGPASCKIGNPNETKISGIEYDHHVPFCKPCSCLPDCIVTSNCCIDYLLVLPEAECADDMLLKAVSDSPYRTPTSIYYSSIQSCPNNTNMELERKCYGSSNLTDKLLSLPVTSYKTFLTYDNIHCASCNNDLEKLETWVLDFDCSIKTDFNILNSVKEIANTLFRNLCSVRTYQGGQDSFVKPCVSKEHVAVTQCNQTGSWLKGDDSIARACAAINQPFGMYKNVFCYICNLPTGAIDVITYCPSESRFYNECYSEPLNPITYPFYNIYTYLSHIGKNNSDVISDILYIKPNDGDYHSYLVFAKRCEPLFVLGSEYEMYNSTEEYYHDFTTLSFDGTKLFIPWQYKILCQKLELFSVFYTMQQLLHEIETNRNCFLISPFLARDLSCFKKTDLIRNCSIENPTFTELIFQEACYSLEDESLLAYKGYYNIFCFMCSHIVDVSMFCAIAYQDLTSNLLKNLDCMGSTKKSALEKIFCDVCATYAPPSVINGPSYRSMFSLSSYGTSIDAPSQTECSSNQIYDKKGDVCRDLMCSPGKILTNNSCSPLLKFTSSLCYKYAVALTGIIEKSNFTTYSTITNNNNQLSLMNEIYLEIMSFLAVNYDYDLTEGAKKAHIISNISCSSTVSNFEGFLYIELCFTSMVDRLKLEQALLESLESVIVISSRLVDMNVTFKQNDEAFKTPLLVGTLSLSGKCIFSKELSIATSDKDIFRFYRVNDLLLCPQVELTEDEFTVQNDHVIFYDNSIGQNDYLWVNDKIRICVDKFEEILSINDKEARDVMLDVVQRTCTVISLVCLILTFITYSLFQSLRTVPGINNMVLVFCLIFNNVLMQIRFIKVSDLSACEIIGVLQHYFILCIFTSFNVCTFHIFRVFTSELSIHAHSRIRILCRYFSYIFGVPAIIILCNILITFFLENQQSIGYGGEMCFIVLRIAAIMTFLIPIGLVLVSNLIMFAAALKHICNQPDIASQDSTRDKRNDIVIYFKLFTITGCSWIFQFIDAFLPESIFSYLISIFSMLTGVFIFCSYICNKRVFDLYKQKVWKTEKDITSKSSHTQRTMVTYKGQGTKSA